jgi:predicted nucleotidyltransferase
MHFDELVLYPSDLSVNERLREVVRICVDRLISCGRLNPFAIILTGSFARGEGTVIRDYERLSVLSDMEFLIVVDDPRRLPEQSREADSIVREIGKKLSASSINCKVEFTLALPRYFIAARPSIFAYELKKHGKTVYGDDKYLKGMPDFAIADIPRSDAFYLICNRIIEQLITYERISSSGALISDAGVMYSFVKMYTDILTSILIFCGKYEPTYAGRLENMKEIKLSSFINGENAEQLNETIVYWSSKKLNPSADLLLPVSGSEALRIWKQLSSMVYIVWLWELGSLIDVKGKQMKYLARNFMMQGHIKYKSMQWIRLLYRAIRMKNFYDIIHARFWNGIPRHMLYMEASRVYFELANIDYCRDRRDNDYLPIRKHGINTQKDKIREILRIWTIYFRNA